MKKFAIKEDLAQAILNYLSEKPFKEVAGLIAELHKIEIIEEPKKEE